jgi:hypothetical protein
MSGRLIGGLAKFGATIGKNGFGEAHFSGSIMFDEKYLYTIEKGFVKLTSALSSLGICRTKSTGRFVVPTQPVDARHHSSTASETDQLSQTYRLNEP